MDRRCLLTLTPTTPARRMGMPRSAAVGMLLWPQTGSSRRRFCSRGYSETSHSGRGLIKGAGDDPARPSDPAPEPVGRPLRRARGRPQGQAHSRTILFQYGDGYMLLDTQLYRTTTRNPFCVLYEFLPKSSDFLHLYTETGHMASWCWCVVGTGRPSRIHGRIWPLPARWPLALRAAWAYTTCADAEAVGSIPSMAGSTWRLISSSLLSAEPL